jgi:diguanylate cyclase (GGDEF)-like protein/hemerythrin-like metal-binding protein
MLKAGLTVAVSIVAATIAIVFFVASRGRKNQALNACALSFGVLSLGMALLFVQGRVTPWLSIVGANIVLFGANLLYVYGVRLFAGRESPWPRRFWAYLAVSAALSIAFTFGYNSYRARAVAFSTYVIVAIVEGLWVLSRDLPALPRRVTITAIGFIGSGVVFHLSRIVLVLWGGEPAGNIAAESAVTSYTLIVVILQIILFSEAIQILDAARLLANLERQNGILETIAIHDKLTGLYNRHAFPERVGFETVRQDRYHLPLSLVMLDIDHFKNVNDLFGHAVGDRVLIEVSRRIRESIRDTDMAFRWGGEEFLVLAPSVDEVAAGALAEKLRRVIMERPIIPAGTVTVCCGVARRLEGEDTDQWILHADQAMYRAKAGGRNRVDVWSDSPSLPRAQVDIQWQSEWDSGDETIDREHRELLYIGNQLLNLAISSPDSPDLRARLDDFMEHLRLHFSDEEAILRRVGYPAAEEHRVVHERLFAEAREKYAEFLSRRGDPSVLFYLLVNKIVMEHLLTVDVKFYDCLHAS